MARSVRRAQESVVSVQSFELFGENSYSRVGSGFIFDSSGLIVTRKSVIHESDSIVVTLANGRQHLAWLVDVDPETEVALLKIHLNRLNPATMGQPSDLGSNSPLAVLGNSIGVFPSVTLGSYQGMGVDDMMLFEGVVPPGNCGSPVLDERGRVVGVLVGRVFDGEQIYSEESGVGVALPIDRVKEAVEFVLRKAEQEKGWVGLTVLDLEGPFRRQGVEIMGLTPGGPAERAGLSLGDTIVGFQGKPIYSSDMLKDWVRSSEPEQKVAFTLKKGVREITMLVRVGSRIWWKNR
jgi:serine protease DegQ